MGQGFVLGKIWIVNKVPWHVRKIWASQWGMEVELKTEEPGARWSLQRKLSLSRWEWSPVSVNGLEKWTRKTCDSMSILSFARVAAILLLTLTHVDRSFYTPQSPPRPFHSHYLPQGRSAKEVEISCSRDTGLSSSSTHPSHQLIHHVPLSKLARSPVLQPHRSSPCFKWSKIESWSVRANTGKIGKLWFDTFNMTQEGRHDIQVFLAFITFMQGSSEVFRHSFLHSVSCTRPEFLMLFLNNYSSRYERT